MESWREGGHNWPAPAMGGGGMRGNEGGRKENSRTFSTINCHKVLLPPLARARGQLIGDGRGKVAISDPPVSICRSLILTASLYFSCKVNIQMTISHLILLVSNSCSVLLDSILSLDRKIIQDYIRLYLVSLFWPATLYLSIFISCAAGLDPFSYNTTCFSVTV